MISALDLKTSDKWAAQIDYKNRRLGSAGWSSDTVLSCIIDPHLNRAEFALDDGHMLLYLSLPQPLVKDLHILIGEALDGLEQ